MRLRWMCPAAMFALALTWAAPGFGQDKKAAPREGDKKTAPRDEGKESARSGSTGVSQFLEDYDDDKDGSISRKELPGRVRGDFDQLDQNKDGKLDRDELQRHGRRMMERNRQNQILYVWVWRAPRDVLTMNDVQQAYDLLRKLDQDNDGNLTKQELQEGRQKSIEHWVACQLEARDTNKDGKLSKDEVRGAFRRRFKDFDSDGDGMITKDEMVKAITANANRSTSATSTEDASDKDSSDSKDFGNKKDTP